MRLALALALSSMACASPPPAASTTCPPASPYGVEEGDRLPDPPLLDCDGNPHSLHELCDKAAAWQFHLARW